jgi:protein tyrosine phosphatase (PTP) superfamily phosphohydrolase (DUF442 family)
MGTDEIYNHIKISDQLITAGQPTADQLRAAADEGFTTVINLGTLDPRYALEDEAGLVRSLGLAYYHIPVEWENPQERDFEAFEQVMAGLASEKTVVHCAANFRVTAFYALFALKHLGWSEAQVDEFRAQIWKGTDNPVWEQFVSHMKAKAARGSHG